MPDYSAGMKAGGSAAGALGTALSGVSGLTNNTAIGKGGEIAAQTLFTAASAANAIPVAGQFASMGLAIAGLFTKLFAGKRKEKRGRAARQQETRSNQSAEILKGAGRAAGAAATSGTSTGRIPDSPVGATAPVAPTPQPSYSGWDARKQPTLEPTQQAVKSSIGI